MLELKVTYMKGIYKLNKVANKGGN